MHSSHSYGQHLLIQRSLCGEPWCVVIDTAQVGGATALIGDPTGHLKDRWILTVDEVERNVLKITENIQRVADNFLSHIDKGRMREPQPFRFHCH